MTVGFPETSIIIDANNRARRCPVVLLLDTSGSMYGQPINELNEGIKLGSPVLVVIS